MTKNEIKQTMIDEYMVKMNLWWNMVESEENETDANKKESIKRLARDFHAQAHAIERLIKACFGDINVYDMWLCN